VYYTLENDSRLLWRAFTPHGPLFGDTEFVAEEQSDLLWNDVRGMDVIDGKLYFGHMDGSLYRMDVNGVTPVPGSIERVSGDGTRKWLTAPPGNGGMYKVSVKIREGSTAYAVSINPTEEAPVPLADFEFSASGSETVGRWQTFRFDVEAGELVDANVMWDDPNATVRVFLRDETNTSVDRTPNTTGSTANVSAVATTSGRWSVGVRVQSGTIEYDVLVNTE